MIKASTGIAKAYEQAITETTVINSQEAKASEEAKNAIALLEKELQLKQWLELPQTKQFLSAIRNYQVEAETAAENLAINSATNDNRIIAKLSESNTLKKVINYANTCNH